MNSTLHHFHPQTRRFLHIISILACLGLIWQGLFGGGKIQNILKNGGFWA
jgi:hypothetical protein